MRLSWTIVLGAGISSGYISVITAEVYDLSDNVATSSQSNLFTFISMASSGGGGGGGGGKSENNTVIITNPTPTEEPLMPQTPAALFGVVLIVAILAIAIVISITKSKTAQEMWAERNKGSII